MMRRFIIPLLLSSVVLVYADDNLYNETFDNDGDLSLVGWTDVYSSGSNGGVSSFAWVWHSGICGNLIYTNEFTVDTTANPNIEFQFDLRAHPFYLKTPNCSIAVQVGGNWYVSKTIHYSNQTVFQPQSLTYELQMSNWDVLNVGSLSRGSAATSDLTDNITAFGLFSDSSNVGGDCTAEYDNFQIFGQSIATLDPDIDGDGIIGFLDFSVFASSWLSESGLEDFNTSCDLYVDGQVNYADLAILADAWLSGAGTKYSPVTTVRERINFNTEWKFYKGNASAAFEHVMLDEAGTAQGQNNWYFGISTSNTGPRDNLMSYDQSWWSWMSCWVYPTDNSSCYISDDRYISENRPPHQYIMKVKCHSSAGQNYIPRIEWVSNHADNSSVQISFRSMSRSDTQRVRILRNGALAWESPDLEVWKPTDFIVNLTDVDNGDILTFMQSAFSTNASVVWCYLTITENSGDLDAASAASYDDSSWDSIILPYEPINNRAYTSWPADTYEGICWYRKQFTLDNSYQGKKLFIEFESANVTTDVWVNSTHLTTHYGGFLPFIIDITDYVYYDGTDNVIAAKVNSFDQPDVPSQPLHGGINGDVWLDVTDPLHVTNAVYADKVAGGGIFVTYPSVSDTQAEVQVKTHVINENATSKDCRLETYIVDSNDMVVAEMQSSQTIAVGGDYTFTQSTTVTNPSLWHPDHPHLYTVHTHVLDGSGPVDNYETRIGIRSISFTKAEGFKINGQPFRFRGANSNPAYPYIGCAVGNQACYRDLLQLKQGGFNYLRSSPEARPGDPSYLDACDELGLLRLDPIYDNDWQNTTLFKNRCYQMMRDLIRRDRNHPSVIAWELSLNEKWWDAPEFSPTAMSIGHEEYPGNQCYVAAWKDSGRWGTEPVEFDIFIATPTAGAREYDGPLPLIISEHGHWEYVDNPGETDSDVRRGQGEIHMLNQAWNHQESHHLNLGLSNMCGDGVFCATDYLGYPSGTIDKFRIPKFSYYFWQSQRDPNIVLAGIDSGPMVYIANYWTASSPTDVKVFSNCEQVKLYINDVLQDTRTPDTSYPTANLLHPPFTFASLTWQPGELKAEGLINGQVVATHIVRTPGSADSLCVEFNVTNVCANGSEILLAYASIVDSSGTLVPDASNEVTFSVAGQASLVSPAMVEAEAGIATALIRVSDQPGLITVTAAASGLTSDDVSITSE